jgi:hypothetical protein
LQKDEWDFETQDLEGIASKELYDDGSAQLSEHQLEKKFQLIGDRFQDALNVEALSMEDLADNQQGKDR